MASIGAGAVGGGSPRSARWRRSSLASSPISLSDELAALTTAGAGAGRAAVVEDGIWAAPGAGAGRAAVGAGADRAVGADAGSAALRAACSRSKQARRAVGSSFCAQMSNASGGRANAGAERHRITTAVHTVRRDTATSPIGS